MCRLFQTDYQISNKDETSYDRDEEFFSFDFNSKAETPSATTDTTAIKYYHLVIVGVLCFLLGGIVIIVFLSHCKPHLLFGLRYLPASPDGDVIDRCDEATPFDSGKPSADGQTQSSRAKDAQTFVDDSLQNATCTLMNSSRTPLINMERHKSKSKI